MLPVPKQTLPARRLAAMAHKGAHPTIVQSFEKAADVFAARYLAGNIRGMIAAFLDDPSATPNPDLRSHAGLIVADDFTVPASGQRRIPGWTRRWFWL